MAQYGGRFGRWICVHTWTLVIASTGLVGLAAVTPTAVLAKPHAPASPPVSHVAAMAGPAAEPATPVRSDPPGELEIDVRRLRRHAQSIAKLIGHPARELVAKLGAAATVGDGTIEWSLVDVGVDAGHAYGYASVVDGSVTGFVIRGRATLDKLLQLHLHRPLQLTRAGGERPSYSITAGE